MADNNTRLINIIMTITVLENGEIKKDGITVKCQEIVEGYIMPRLYTHVKMNGILVGKISKYKKYGTDIYWEDWVIDTNMKDKYFDFLLGLEDIVNKENDWLIEQRARAEGKAIRNKINKIGL